MRHAAVTFAIAVTVSKRKPVYSARSAVSKEVNIAFLRHTEPHLQPFF